MFISAIARKIDNIARNLNYELKSIISIFAYYIGIQENTDARNSTRLSVFIPRHVYLKIRGASGNYFYALYR